MSAADELKKGLLEMTQKSFESSGPIDRPTYVVRGERGDELLLDNPTANFLRLLAAAAHVKDQTGQFQISFESLVVALLVQGADVFSGVLDESRRRAIADGILRRRGVAWEEVERMGEEPVRRNVPFSATRSGMQILREAVRLQRGTELGRLGAKHLVAALLYGDHDHLNDLGSLGIDLERTSLGYLEYVKANFAAGFDLVTDLHQARYGQGASSSPPTSSQLGLSGHIHTDLWTTVDSLDYYPYAYAIARFLTNANTRPPLTISIQAPWGGGKTSLMRMIQGVLDPKGLELAERHAKRRAAKHQTSTPEGMNLGNVLGEISKRLEDGPEPLPKLQPAKLGITVWFNAWKYESTQQVWAGLVDAILHQVPERLSKLERERFWLRLNLGRVDAGRVRQRLHDYFIHRVLKTTAGWGWALVGALAGATGGYVVSLPQAAMTAMLGTSQLSLIAATALVVGGSAKAFAAQHQAKAEPVAEVFKDLVDVPKYDENMGFVHQVERDLRRVFDALPAGQPLVIFIDDLDRCSPAKIAQVLEAINLFLAGDFPDCYFVIGMDTEMVAAALQAAHKDLLASLGSDSRIPVGWRFMDKFVQLPFVIPPADKETYKRFLAKLFVDAPPTTPAPQPKPEDKHPPGPPVPPSATPPAVTPPSAQEPDFITATRTMIDAGIAQFREDDPVVRGHLEEAIAYFEGIPRDVKRFVNAFRFYYFVWWARRSRAAAAPSLEALVNWTILTMKWPEHVRWLRKMEGRDFSHEELKSAFEDHLLVSSDSENPHRLVECALRMAKDTDMEVWAKALQTLYALKAETGWLRDPALFSFYVTRCRGKGSLADSAGTGFW